MSSNNSSPDNSTPDNATPDNATPDDADNSSNSNSASPPPPPSSSSPPPPTSSSPPPSPPPPDSSLQPPRDSFSPPPPSENSSAPPPPIPSSPPDSPANKSPPSPPSSQASSQSPPSPPASSNRSPPSSSDLPSHKSLPSSKTPSPPKSDGAGDDNNKAIVGSVLGLGSILLLFVVVCVIFSRRKKKKKMYYYGDLSKPGQASNYYNSGEHPPYYGGPRGGDHVVKVQNGMGHNGGGWSGQPPPPQMNSAEMSSNYSGPPAMPPPSPGLSLGLKGGTFSYEELAAATNGFAEENMIGQGGFGYVFKGVLPNGKEVAVKCLKAGSGQGEREFKAEIDSISRIHHRHLVSLVGYSMAGAQRMLVYEFIPNQTLEYHLHGKGLPTMDWSTRLRIAIGSAKGLAYLHEDCEPRIIHRDIKAANVLIDDSFEAKVADFGLAKLTNDNNTHVSTRVMGTFGYLAPEYASSGKLTEKSDVFSFGVMLLELISGKRPVDPTNAMEDSLVDWARPLLTRGLEEDGNFGELVDPFLEGNYNPQEMTRMAACAASSIRHSAKRRPRMSQIVRILEGDVSLDDLKEGGNRGTQSVFTPSSGSSDYDTMQYNADLQKFRKAVFSSQEYGTSSGSSGDLGRPPKQPQQQL